MDEIRRRLRMDVDFEQEVPATGSLYIAGIRLFLLLFCLLVWAGLLLGLNEWLQLW